MQIRKTPLLVGVVIALLSVFPVWANETLPQKIVWLTNASSPVFASEKAKKGGAYHDYMLSFPLTIRTVGPDSNMGVRDAILANQLSLINIHPNTEEIIPELATHWAFADDKKTMYFKLDQRARWSDGHHVTADDFLFTLDFMRSKNIVAPWYNNYYSEEIDRVVKYDDYTIAVVSKKVVPDLHFRLGISPTPRHFYKNEVPTDFVRQYNWKVVPNTGPYQISKINKGKSIVFKRKKDWWAADLRYFRGRFNVDTVVYTVIREEISAFEYFKKNQLASFSLALPDYWHEKAMELPIYQKGYVKKTWFYNDTPRSSFGFYLNQDIELFKDRNVRYAFGHSIHMKKLLTEVLRGDFSRLQSCSIGYGKYTNTEVRARTFDIEKVAALMAASGWARGADGIWEKGGLRFSVRILYGYKDYTQWLVVLKEEAKKAGVELILQLLDGSTMLKMAAEKKHEVVLMGLSGALRPQYWGSYHSVHAHKPQTNNLTNTADAEMDSLIDQYRTVTNEADRIALAKAIQAKVHDIGAFVPMFVRGYFREIYWRWWQFPDVPATKLSSSLFSPFGDGLFWFDPALEKETLAAMKTGEVFEPETIIDESFRVE